MISLNVPNSQSLKDTVVVTCSGSPAPQKVDFYLDGVLKFTDTASSFAWSFNTTTVADGAHTLKAIATRNNGKQTMTAILPVLIANVVAPPVGVAPANTSLPTIGGTPTQGQTLTMTSPGGWSNAPTSFQYAWLRNGVAISGAIGTTYALVLADVGTKTRIRVTALNGYGSASALSAETAFIAPLPAPPAPPAGLPFLEAQVRTSTVLTVPVLNEDNLGGAGSPVNGGADCTIDLQNLRRTEPLLIFGKQGQRIKVINCWWVITKPIDGSPYWRGGPRVRSSDGLGPEHISFTNVLIQGSTLADAVAIDSSPNTVVTFQRCRVEATYQTTGVNTTEPAEHCDGFQVQGMIKELQVGLATVFANSVNAPNDGGKCFMLNQNLVPGYVVRLSSVNMRGQGDRTGTFFFQDQRTIVTYLTDVWAHKEGAGAFVWASGSGLFWPNSSTPGGVGWTSSGTAPNRIADWPDSSGIYGTIKEGLPVAGDFVTRAMLGH